jgi:hypothetical protein
MPRQSRMLSCLLLLVELTISTEEQWIFSASQNFSPEDSYTWAEISSRNSRAIRNIADVRFCSNERGYPFPHTNQSIEMPKREIESKRKRNRVAELNRRHWVPVFDHPDHGFFGARWTANGPPMRNQASGQRQRTNPLDTDTQRFFSSVYSSDQPGGMNPPNRNDQAVQYLWPTADEARSITTQDSLTDSTQFAQGSALRGRYFRARNITTTVGMRFWDATNNPSSFRIVEHENHGSYEMYSYQLYDVGGHPLMEQGYSVNEHVNPQIGITSNDEFVPMTNGMMYDEVGWLDPPSQARLAVVTQTFTVQYQGQIYELTTTLQHEHRNPSPLGGATNEVRVIVP